MGRLQLLKAVVYKQFLLRVRYPFNTAAMFFTNYLFFAAIFFGGQAAANQISGNPAAVTKTFNGLIVGWFLWTMSVSAYFGLASNISDESKWGTLEQLYMSPYGFGSVIVTKVVANLMESLVWGAAILLVMLVTTGRMLTIDLVTIIPIVLFSLMSVVGIGFLFGGLALIYKEIGNISQLVQFVLVGLVAAPTADLPLLRFLPLVKGSTMLQEAMRNGVRLWEFPIYEIATLVVVGGVYSFAGYLVFKLCTYRARKDGLMGDY